MSRLLQPEFADIDRHFANFIGRFGGDDTLLPLAAALLSRSIREGNICLPLGRAPSHVTEAKDAGLPEWPAAKEWRSALASSKAVGGPDAQTPLVIDDSDRCICVAIELSARGRCAPEKARAPSKARPGRNSGRGDRRCGQGATIISVGLERKTPTLLTSRATLQELGTRRSPRGARRTDRQSRRQRNRPSDGLATLYWRMQ